MTGRSTALALVALAAALVGCSTAVGGHGGAALPAAAIRSASSTPTAATTAPATAPPATSSRPAPESPAVTAAPPSAAPTTAYPAVAAPAPPQCSGGLCPELSHSYVKDGYQIVLRQGIPNTPGAVTSVVELLVNGVPAQWHTESDEYDPHLTCSTRTPHLHCVLAAVVGAHSAQAQLYLASDGRFVLPQPVVTDTPDIRAVDLDGDGDLDLQVAVNDYEPDYADGGTYWQTWRLYNQAYIRTGCTATAYGQEPTPPSTLIYGACPG